jgi:hypothetical protein
LSENISLIREKMLPLDEAQRLIEGSFEQLAVRLDEAVQENRSLFVGESNSEVTRLATFPGRVVVAVSDGRYFEAKYSDKDGSLVIENAKAMDVPVIDSSNAADFVRSYTLSAVDAILSEDTGAALTKILALSGLQEDQQTQAERDYIEEVSALLQRHGVWRTMFAEQPDDLRRQVVDKLEAIREAQLDSKYKPLYETDDIPEEKFEDYRDLVVGDLHIIAERLETAQHNAEKAYLPFVEAMSEAELEEEEAATLGEFSAFAEDYIGDLQEMRELIVDALKNEQCVSCLGHIYDQFTEALNDLEVASAFVERMSNAFDEAE